MGVHFFTENVICTLRCYHFFTENGKEYLGILLLICTLFTYAHCLRPVLPLRDFILRFIPPVDYCRLLSELNYWAV